MSKNVKSLGLIFDMIKFKLCFFYKKISLHYSGSLNNMVTISLKRDVGNPILNT